MESPPPPSPSPSSALAADPVARATDEPSARRVELRLLVTLAGPLVAAQVGNQMMNFVDSAMVGRLGAAALGGVGIGNAVYFSLTVFGLGCVLGTDPLVAQAIGAGDRARARRVLDGGLRVALTVGVPLTILVALAPWLVRHAGVEESTAIETRRYLVWRSLNVIPFLVFSAQRSYLQARSTTLPIFLGMVVANVANLVGNYLLIYGDHGLALLHLPAFGVPALGVPGAAIASVLSSLLSLGITTLAVRFLDEEDAAEARRPAALDGAGGETAPKATAPVSMGSIFALGLPLGLQLGAEVGVFGLASVLAGRISTLAAAANQVAITLASVTFTVCVGIGAATSVRVGIHVGRGDRHAARRAGLLGVGVSLAWMSFTALTFVLAPRLLARTLTDDAELIAATVPLLWVAALFQLSDGTQATAAGALRGAGDTVASFVANLVGHWFLGLPVAIVLGFTFHLGATGLWIGLSVGLTAVAVALVARFVHLCSKPIARV